jgi:hypothetical protein
MPTCALAAVFALELVPAASGIWWKMIPSALNAKRSSQLAAKNN